MEAFLRTWGLRTPLASGPNLSSAPLFTGSWLDRMCWEPACVATALLGPQEILQADGRRGILGNVQLRALKGLKVH